MICLSVGDPYIQPVNHARNLGVIFESSIAFKNHISHTVRSASFYIRNIEKIHKHLDHLSTVNSSSTYLLRLIVLTWGIHVYLAFQMSNILIFNAYKILLFVWSLKKHHS